MEILHLIYQHWFVTILVLLFGVTPVVHGVGGFALALVAKARGK